MINKFHFADNNIPYYNISCSEKHSISGAQTHIHDYFEIDIFITGKGKTVINQTKYDVLPHSVFLITPADVHSYILEEKATVLTVSFTQDILEYSPFLEMLYPMQYISSLLNDKQFKTLLNYIDIIREESQVKRNFGKKYVSMLLSCILIDLYRLKDNNSGVTYNSIPYYIPVQRALYYLRAHFKENISLKSVAEYANISPSTLSKNFSKYIKIGFNEYLINLRLEYAKMLIINTSEQITDIAFYSGFNSLSYFQRLFMEKYSITPKSLRKKSSSGTSNTKELEEDS